jgi:hypothetical protein
VALQNEAGRDGIEASLFPPFGRFHAALPLDGRGFLRSKSFVDEVNGHAWEGLLQGVHRTVDVRGAVVGPADHEMGASYYNCVEGRSRLKPLDFRHKFPGLHRAERGANHLEVVGCGHSRPAFAHVQSKESSHGGKVQHLAVLPSRHE